TVDSLGFARPFESGAQVGMLLRKTRQPESLIRPTQLRRGSLCERAVIIGMLRSEHRRFPVDNQLLPPILTHELEQAEARLPIAFFYLNDQTPPDETGKPIKDGHTKRCIPAADSVCRLQRPPVDEDGEPAKQKLLGCVEQVIAPLDGAAHR